MTYSGYLMIMRRVDRSAGTAGPVAISTAMTAVVCALAGSAVGSLDLVPSLPNHFWLILLGLSAQAAGYLLISYSLPRLPAVQTSIILLAQPVIAVLTAIVLVPELPSPEQFLGVAFVIGGIALATIPMRIAASVAGRARPKRGEQPVVGRSVSDLVEMGWPMGVEPITFGTTIRCSAG